VGPTGSLADALGIRTLAGPFLLAAVVYGLAAALLAVLLRPDPLLAARAWALADRPPGPDRPVGSAEAPGLLRLGATAMVATQIVMVAVMTMTPIHMRDHGHGLGATGLVIAVHVGAMFLPSPLTGLLADRFGRRPVLVAGAASLLCAGGLAALAPTDSTVLLAVALGLLGLGWNFGLVAGTAMVTDATPLSRRARTQGSVDLGVALAGAAGGMGSGLVVAGAGYSVLALGGGLVALALIPVLLAGEDPSTPRPPAPGEPRPRTA
jgi:MFS family permease